MEIDLKKAIHFDPEKIKKLYNGDYEKLAQDLANENLTTNLEKIMYKQKIERLNVKIDNAVNHLRMIYMLDNVEITNNACEVIDETINILKRDDE